MTENEWKVFVGRLKEDHRGEGVNRHYTADPIFLVQEEKRVWGMDTEYAEGTAYVEQDSGDYHEYEALQDYIKELDEDQVAALHHDAEHVCDERLDALDDDDLLYLLNHKGYSISLAGYVDRWEYVSAHFTMQAAEDYIRHNKYRHGKLRVYVDSQYRCYEFNTIIKAILDGEIVYAVDK